MDFSAVIYAVGATGIFPSRAFIPAFATALLLRFGQHLPLLHGCGLIPDQPVTGWFTSNSCLLILGVLAALEIAATKNNELRQYLNDVDAYLKPGVAALATLGFLSAGDVKTLHAVQQAGPAGSSLLAVLAAGGVYTATVVRQAALDMLTDADEDDSTGVQHFLSWFEDAWGLLAVLLLFALPLLSLCGILTAMGLLRVFCKRLERGEEQRKVPCTKCAAPVYRAALACPSCQHPVAQPCTLGFLGSDKTGKAAAPGTHAFLLAAHKRCAVCATRLGHARPGDSCSACGHKVLAEPAFVAAYERWVHSRWDAVLPLTFLFGLLPGLGSIPGVIYYRVTWVAPYRRYLPRWRSLLTRLLVGAVSFLLLLLQWVPVVGAVSLPLMALLHHALVRRAFCRQLGLRSS